MKKILIILVTAVFLGAGCVSEEQNFSQNNNSDNLSTTSTPEEVVNVVEENVEPEAEIEENASSLLGEWRFAMAGKMDMRMDKATLFIQSADEGSAEENLTGSIIAELQQDGELLYDDYGTFTAIKKAGDTSVSTYDVVWQGSREDVGTATLVYDEVMGTIEWQTEVEKYDGKFTIPKSMVLYQEQMSLLNEEDKKVIEEKIKEVYSENDVIISYDMYMQNTLRITLSLKNSEIVRYVFLRNIDNEWQVILGPAVTVTEKEALEKEIPVLMIYN